jgi:hypothetical protein
MRTSNLSGVPFSVTTTVKLVKQARALMRVYRVSLVLRLRMDSVLKGNIVHIGISHQR